MAYILNNNMAGSDGDDYLGNVTISAGGTYSTGATYALTGTSGSVYAVGGGSGSSWTTAASPYIYTTAGSNGSSPSLSVSGDADIKGDLTVRGINIAETLSKINERLAILVPDPKRLEKYEALKQAYEHYKTLEALCVEQDNPPSTT